MGLIAQTDSRIANSSRVWQGSCNVDITDWVKADEFIVACYALSDSVNPDSDCKLQWRRVGGTFADVGADTEICWGTDTVLVDAGALLEANSAGCFVDWDDGVENEGDNLCYLLNIKSGDYGECQFALGFGSGALDNQEYELQLVVIDWTSSAVLQTTIKTEAGAAEQTLIPTAIPSGEGFGTDGKVNLRIFPSELSGGEAFGLSQLNLRIFPNQVDGGEAFGTHQLNMRIFPNQVSSEEGLGEPSIGARISPTAIPSLETFGSPDLNLRIFPSQVDGGESFGTLLVNAIQKIFPWQFGEYDLAQLFDDTGLEIWTSPTDLTNWVEGIAGTNTINRESTDPHGGTYCLRMDVDDDADDCWFAQAKTLGASKIITWRGWYKTSAGKIGCLLLCDSGANLYLNLYGTWQASPAYCFVLQPSTTWKPFEFSFETSGSYTDYNMYLSRLSVAGGSIWFDDVEIATQQPERFGTAEVKLITSLIPTAITSQEAFGNAQLNMRIFLAEIAGAEAFGTTKLNHRISPTAIPSEEGLGSPQLNLRLLLQPVPSGEAFGTPTLGLYLLPTAIASLEAFGEPVLLKITVLQPTAIPGAEAFGTAKLNLRIYPAAAASAEAFGAPFINLQQTLIAEAIASLEAFGSPQLNLRILAAAVASGEAFGIPTIALEGKQDLFPAAIPSAEAFGLPYVGFGAQQWLYPVAISSEEIFGLLRLLKSASGSQPAREEKELVLIGKDKKISFIGKKDIILIDKN